MSLTVSGDDGLDAHLKNDTQYEIEFSTEASWSAQAHVDMLHAWLDLVEVLEELLKVNLLKSIATSW